MWFRERDQPRELKDVILDHRIDGQCVTSDSHWLDKVTDDMGRRWADRDIRKFEKAIRALQAEYERERRRRGGSTRRGRSRGRDSRRDRSSSYDSRDDSPRDRRRKVPKTTSEDVWIELGGGKEIEKKSLRTYLFHNPTLPMPPAARDAIFNRLDPDGSNYITEDAFFGIFPKNHSFKKSLREAYHDTGLSKKKKGSRKRSPAEQYTFDDKIQGDALLKYVEYSCGPRYCRYAKELERQGKTAIDLQNAPNHVFNAVIRDQHDCRKLMNAFRCPDKTAVEDVLNDMNRSARKKKKPKTKPCPRNPEDVWDLMDDRGKRYIKKGNFLKILEEYCAWISEDDAIQVFKFIEDRDSYGKVYEREFLDHWFRHDDFEADLEKLVKKTNGKSKRKTKYLGKDVFRKICKYSDRRDQRVYSRDFKEFLTKKLGKNRDDARDVWNYISRKSGQERMDLEEFHTWFPRNEEFDKHFESNFRDAVRDARKAKKSYVDFATLDDEQLKMWLSSLRLEDYHRVLRRYRVFAKDLVRMRVEELEDIIGHREDAYFIMEETQNQEHLRTVFKHDIMMKAARSKRSRSRKRSDSLDSRKSTESSDAGRGRSRRRDGRSRSREKRTSRRRSREKSGDRRRVRDRSKEDDRRRVRDRSKEDDRRRGRDRSKDDDRRRGRDRSKEGDRRAGRRDRRSSDDWSMQGNAEGQDSTGKKDRRDRRRDSPRSTRGGRRERDRSAKRERMRNRYG